MRSSRIVLVLLVGLLLPQPTAAQGVVGGLLQGYFQGREQAAQRRMQEQALQQRAEQLRLERQRQEDVFRQQEDYLNLEQQRQELYRQQLALEQQRIQQQNEVERRRQWEDVRKQAEQLIRDSRWRWAVGDAKAKEVLAILNQAYAALDMPVLEELPAVAPPEFTAEELARMCGDAVAYVSVVSSKRELSSGTAFFITPDGLMLTCAHVVQASYEGSTIDEVIENSGAYVRTADGKVLSATCIYCDEASDIALLYVAGTQRPFLTLSTTKPAVGSEALVLGFPLGSTLGKELSVTRGIVSSVRAEGEIFQLDAAVNSGNSGGPVLNKQGQVSGIAFAKIRNAEGVNLAIAARAIPSVDTMISQSPLFGASLRIAIEHGDADKAGSILKQAPRLAALPLNKDGWTALHLCAKHGKPDFVKTLVETGGDINALATDGRTPLMIAVCAKEPKVVDELLRNGADVNATDAARRTALEVACSLASRQDVYGRSDYLDMALALVSVGADVNAARSDGESPFTTVLSMRNGEELAESMIQKGADVNRASYGMPPLYLACLYDAKPNLVKAIIAAGANVNSAETDSGETALHTAACGGRSDIVEMLIAGGARIDPRDHYAPHSISRALAERTKKPEDQDGSTPLALACRLGRASVVKVLLAAGANVNTANSAGMTPLHMAASQGHVDVIRLLVAKGAKLTLKDKQYKLTPMGHAMKNKHDQAARVLRLAAKRG